MTNRLTADQIADYKEAFELFNKDGNGYIGFEELGTILRSLGEDLSEVNLYNMFDAVDIDGDGKIDLSQVLELVGRLHEDKESVENLIAMFETFDKNGSGMIAASEVRSTLLKSGQGLTEKEVNEVMKYANADSYGYIDYREFAKKLSTV